MFRYRYDTETGLYYLQSRYYNPEWGRLINIDGTIGHMGELLSHNLFTYSKNNPVNMSDSNGFSARWNFDDGNGAGGGGGILLAIYYGIVNIGTKVSNFFSKGNVAQKAQSVEKVAERTSQAGEEIAATTQRMGKTAYDIAKEGGKHSGFYKQYINRTTEQILKGIKSIQSEIVEHTDKIQNPKKYIDNFFELDPRQQQALINKKWPSDIHRQKEQLDVLIGILSERGIK